MSLPEAIEQDVTASVSEDFDEMQSLSNSVEEDRAPSPVFSCISMRTDHSMGQPISFKQEASTDSQVQQEAPCSSTSTCIYPDSEDPEEHIQDKIPNLRPGEMACDFCSEKKKRAVKSCLTCAASYCETHIKQHYTVPVLQKHKLVDISGDLEDWNSQQNVEDWITRALLPPGNIKFCSVGADFVTLSWDEPEGLAEKIQHFIVTWCDERRQHSLKVKGRNKITIENLNPGNKYVFKLATVADGGHQSAYVSAPVHTAVPAPDSLSVEELHARSFTVKWNKPEQLEQIPHRYLISSTCPGAELVYTSDLAKTFSNLEPDTLYTVEVSTVLENGEQSQPTSEDIHTKRVKKRPWDYDYEEDESEEDESEEDEEDYAENYGEDYDENDEYESEDY